MKFKKNMKKGFTLVELIVVIAIVAILAAVSVVSYLAFINSANESADIQLVKQLNTCLQADEALHGKKDWSEDYQGLRDLLEGNGFIVENLTKTKSGCDMVYQGKIDDDHIINRYALLNGDKVLYSETTFAESNNCRNLWIPETAKEAQDLSDKGKGVVLGEELGHIDTFNAKGSVIVSGANVNQINYSNDDAEHPQTVVIRTNSPESVLTVNAPADTVHHYDNLGELTVTAVANASYHEHGIVSGKVIISQGHFEIEKNAVVSSVSVQAATGAVKITANERTTVMVDTASATQTTVVANAESVNVAGLDAEKISGDKASTVVEATKVMNESELNTAFSNSKPFVQLGADIELTSYKDILAETKFDLNGHTVTVPANVNFGFCPISKTELFDSVGTGKIVGAGLGNSEQYLVFVDSDATFVMNGGELKNSGKFGIFARYGGDVTVNSGKITDCQYGIYDAIAKVEINNCKITGSEHGVTVLGNNHSGSGELVMNGGEITSTGYGITGNGGAGLGGTSIEINGGKVSGEDLGIYQPQNGVLKVKGNAEISGKTALYIKSGFSTISGGNFVATLTPKAAYNYNGNGGTPTGDAIVIDACNYPGGNPSVEITIDNASFTLADSSAKNVAYYSHQNGAAVVVVNGQTLEPVIG